MNPEVSNIVWQVVNKIGNLESLLLAIRENADPHLQRMIDRSLDIEETDNLIRKLRGINENS